MLRIIERMEGIEPIILSCECPQGGAPATSAQPADADKGRPHALTSRPTSPTAPEAPRSAQYAGLAREHTACGHLGENRIQDFVPETWDRTQRRDRPARRLQVPHCLFARLALADEMMAHIPWAARLGSSVSFEARAAGIPDDDDAYGRRPSAEMLAASTKQRYLRAGRVHDTRGPCEGLDALFGRWIAHAGSVRGFPEYMRGLMPALSIWTTCGGRRGAAQHTRQVPGPISFSANPRLGGGVFLEDGGSGVAERRRRLSAIVGFSSSVVCQHRIALTWTSSSSPSPWLPLWP